MTVQISRHLMGQRIRFSGAVVWPFQDFFRASLEIPSCPLKVIGTLKSQVLFIKFAEVKERHTSTGIHFHLEPTRTVRHVAKSVYICFELEN